MIWSRAAAGACPALMGKAGRARSGAADAAAEPQESELPPRPARYSPLSPFPVALAIPGPSRAPLTHLSGRSRRGRAARSPCRGPGKPRSRREGRAGAAPQARPGGGRVAAAVCRSFFSSGVLSWGLFSAAQSL